MFTCFIHGHYSLTDACPICNPPSVVSDSTQPFSAALPTQQEQEKADEFYPENKYQRLFNKLRDWNFIAINSEMHEIIDIVHQDFPHPSSLPVSDEGAQKETPEEYLKSIKIIMQLRKEAYSQDDDEKYLTKKEVFDIIEQADNNHEGYWRKRCEAAERVIETTELDLDTKENADKNYKAYENWQHIKNNQQ